jgi:hypothetical protein
VSAIYAVVVFFAFRLTLLNVACRLALSSAFDVYGAYNTDGHAYATDRAGMVRMAAKVTRNMYAMAVAHTTQTRSKHGAYGRSKGTVARRGCISKRSAAAARERTRWRRARVGRAYSLVWGWGWAVGLGNLVSAAVT